MGTQSYRLELPDDWRVHPVFHVSLLKLWRTGSYHAQEPALPPTTLDPADSPAYDVERILRWRCKRSGRRTTREFYVVWRGCPISEASWIPETNFLDCRGLEELLATDQPLEDTPS